MAKINAIFFDIGDTLYFSEDMEKQYPRKLYELISAREGISIEDAKAKLKEASERLEGKIPHVTKVAAMETLGYSRADVHSAFCSVNPADYLKEEPDLRDFLEELSMKFSLGIISNFKKKHIIEILVALGVSPKNFEYFVTEDVVTNIKPDLEPFQKAVSLSGQPASNCVYVADSISKDLRPAKEVGMQTFWVNSKTPKEDQLAWVDIRCASVLELRSRLL